MIYGCTECPGVTGILAKGGSIVRINETYLNISTNLEPLNDIKITQSRQDLCLTPNNFFLFVHL